VCIAKEYLDAFLSAQILLIGKFDAGTSGMVSLYIVVVLLNIMLTNLSNIAEYMGGTSVLIITESTVTDVETGELVQFFLKSTVLLYGELWDKNLRDVRGITRVEPFVGNVFESLDKPFVGDTERGTKIDSIERDDLPLDDHDIISRLIVNKEASHPVVNHTARRIDGTFKESVTVCPSPVIHTKDLQVKEAEEENDNDGDKNAVDDVLSIRENGCPFPGCHVESKRAESDRESSLERSRGTKRA
jgi:hypothetical protein